MPDFFGDYVTDNERLNPPNKKTEEHNKIKFDHK